MMVTNEYNDDKMLVTHQTFLAIKNFATDTVTKGVTKTGYICEGRGMQPPIG